MNDVVICNFPPMLPWYLPAAPAILTGACRWLGLSSTFIDFNQRTDDLDTWAKEICSHDPKILAFSIFSYKSRKIATDLAHAVKQINPTIKIVAGGNGIKDSIGGSCLLDQPLFDYHIDGDGEVQWPNFLIKYFNINRTVDFTSMNIPYSADYSDYTTSRYLKHNQRLWVPVTGSRGCVRQCTFCEIHQRWKFQQRNPTSIALEVLSIVQKFPDVHIHFTDSLVNGSLPAFTQLLDQLTEIKQQYPKFTWGGQFIIRNKKQCDSEYWRKISESGAESIEIGIETGSDSLRQEMGKHFTNEDLDHSLTYMSQFNITCVLMFFVGYPTETIDDFNQTLLLLEKYQSYAGTIINSIQAGYNLSIAPSTPLYSDSLESPTMVLSKNPSIWFNQLNPTLTYLERQRRRIQLSTRSVELGYQMSYDNSIAIHEIEENIKQNSTIIKIVERKFGKNTL